MSHERRSTQGRAVASAGVRWARAFTLPELLVVIGIIAMLVTILAPSMSQALDVAYDRTCKGHLYRLGQAMQRGGMGSDGTSTPFALPESSGWVGLASDLGKDLLLCPKDESGGVNMGNDSIANYYILQQQGDSWYISDLAAALGIGGGTLQDGQVYADGGARPLPVHAPPHVPGGHPCFSGIPDRQPNQKLVAVCSEARVLITFGPGSMVRFESIVGCGVDSTDSVTGVLKVR